MSNWSHKYKYILSKDWSEACLLNDVMNWSHTNIKAKKHAFTMRCQFDHLRYFFQILKWSMLDKWCDELITYEYKSEEACFPKEGLTWSHKYKVVLSSYVTNLEHYYWYVLLTFECKNDEACLQNHVTNWAHKYWYVLSRYSSENMLAKWCDELMTYQCISDEACLQ